MVIQAIQDCLSSPLTPFTLTTLKNLQPSFLRAVGDLCRDPSQRAHVLQIMERMKQIAVELPLSVHLERIGAGDPECVYTNYLKNREFSLDNFLSVFLGDFLSGFSVVQ